LHEPEERFLIDLDDIRIITGLIAIDDAEQNEQSDARRQEVEQGLFR
jgi:hypothetical protein